MNSCAGDAIVYAIWAFTGTSTLFVIFEECWDWYGRILVDATCQALAAGRRA